MNALRISRPGLRADGDVLQVRIGRRQPSRRRDGLIERRVHAAVAADELRQRVDVRALQLVQLAMLQDELRHGEAVRWPAPRALPRSSSSSWSSSSS